jgi:hypothetical protein
MSTVTWPCKGSGGCGATYSAELTSESPAEWTEDDWGAFMDAQSEHLASHGRTAGAGVHIRKKITARGGYSPTNPLHDRAAFRASSAYSGAQTLCGDPSTDSDISWADGRFAKHRQYVTCARCLELRPS